MADETLDFFASNEPNGVKAASSDTLGLQPRLNRLAKDGSYVGTSSWKYPGWNGLVYSDARYQTRGRFSQAKFEKTCLEEYAQTFSTVCVDAGYYQFPTPGYLADLCAQVPEGFKFAFKVTDDITIKQFPGLPRFGARRGMVNPNFLNAEMCQRLFLGPCEAHRSKIGPLIFEFSTFSKQEFEHGRDFVEALDRFFSALPKGWQYGVEIRNKGWLVPEYFAMLRSHNVAHVYNNWTRMPSVGEQMAIEGSETADFSVARFLLKPGRTYEAAVEQFSPYREVKERQDEARTAAARLLESSFTRKRFCYIYINNRLEGCAPLTADAIMRLSAIPCITIVPVD